MALFDHVNLKYRYFQSRVFIVYLCKDCAASVWTSLSLACALRDFIESIYLNSAHYSTSLSLMKRRLCRSAVPLVYSRRIPFSTPFSLEVCVRFMPKAKL